MASFLQAENLSKSYGDRVLFRNISFNINEGDKIALIAPNGTGKSSLLKILAGVDSSDRGGEVRFMRDLRVAFLVIPISTPSARSSTRYIRVLGRRGA